MYWPTSAARIIAVPAPLADEPVTRVRPSRRGNLFVTLGDTGLGVWDVRPTILQAAVVRSQQSVERWGANADVYWATDARSLVVLVSSVGRVGPSVADIVAYALALALAVNCSHIDLHLATRFAHGLAC